MNFAQKLHARILEKNTRLCLGLDPRLEFYQTTEQAAQHTLEVLESCSDLIACVKPQVAFYEAMGMAGWQLLEQICVMARGLEIPIILDAKRGDIASSAQAYAKAWLTGQHAGSALTINPYLGFETITPFLSAAQENKGAVFVLVKTSNSGSKDLQDLETKNGTIAQIIATHLETLTDTYGAVGAVVGATHASELEAWRKLMPNVLLLLPGLGAQGAKAADLAAAFDQNGLGAVASASRAIQYADLTAREAAKGLRDQLNAALGL